MQKGILAERFIMSGFIFFLIPIALAATAAILGVGIYSLAKGGAFAKENSNKLMRMRIAAQAVAIALMMLFLWLAGKGGA
jgi:hypoxia induced protein